MSTEYKIIDKILKKYKYKVDRIRNKYPSNTKLMYRLKS